MGFVGPGQQACLSTALWLALCLGLGSSSGCDGLSDPSTPCGTLELGDAEPGTMVSRRRAPVLAWAGGSFGSGSNEPFVLHHECKTAADAADLDAQCVLRRTTLADLGSGQNAVLVTSAGEYVLSTDRGEQQLHIFRFNADGTLDGDRDDEGRAIGQRFPLRADLPVELLASLRGSNWIIGLDEDRQLRRYWPGEDEAARIAPEHPNLTLATVGEQHIIGRVRHGSGDDSLYLVPIDDGLDGHLHPRLLLRGREATRIVIGPRDENVAVTLGHGDTAQTLVFRIPDGELVDRFDGALISGREDLTETTGLRAVSPDGSHLAYKTAAGSIALRDISSGSACLVRSAKTSGSTRLAGFSAEGLLYFESELGPGETSISVWNAADRYLAVLSPPEVGARLAAVPSRTPPDAMPWAVGVRSGSFMALADSQPPTSIDLDDAVFIPRDDADLWVLGSDSLTGGARRIDVRRLTSHMTPAATLRFGELESAQHETGNGEELKTHETLGVVVAGPQTACLSTGTPGTRAYACGSGSDRDFFSGATSPKGEDPDRPSQAGRSPEIPDLEHPRCGPGGSPYDPNDCEYKVGECCYAFQAGCEEQCGNSAACDFRRDHGDYKTLTCGSGAGFP
ncbi:MAG: hypothetical protein KUG77_22855 [Nannocystaceae bacterium]|nr:hypothetical protein [Nannocystaceae bacterium]